MYKIVLTLLLLSLTSISFAKKCKINIQGIGAGNFSSKILFNKGYTLRSSNDQLKIGDYILTEGNYDQDWKKIHGFNHYLTLFSSGIHRDDTYSTSFVLEQSLHQITGYDKNGYVETEIIDVMSVTGDGKGSTTYGQSKEDLARIIATKRVKALKSCREEASGNLNEDDDELNEYETH